MTIQTYNIETPTQDVSGCNSAFTPAVLVQRNSLINKILPTNNVTEVSLFFVNDKSKGYSNSQNFVVKRDLLFYIRNSGQNQIVLCVDSYSKLNETDRPEPICVETAVPITDYQTTESVTFDVIEFDNSQFNFLVTFKEYNHNIGIYSKLTVHYLKLRSPKIGLDSMRKIH